MRTFPALPKSQSPGYEAARIRVRPEDAVPLRMVLGERTSGRAPERVLANRLE